MAKSQSADQSVARPRNDAYTGLLAISFLALVGACVLLYLEYDSYGGQNPPPVPNIDVPGAKLGKFAIPDRAKKEEPAQPKDEMAKDMPMMKDEPPKDMPAPKDEPPKDMPAPPKDAGMNMSRNKGPAKGAVTAASIPMIPPAITPLDIPPKPAPVNPATAATIPVPSRTPMVPSNLPVLSVPAVPEPAAPIQVIPVNAVKPVVPQTTEVRPAPAIAVPAVPPAEKKPDLLDAPPIRVVPFVPPM
jgi:hypothetical protein